MSDLAKYIGNAEMFPVLRHWHFFNHAGVSPLPKVAGDAMRKFAAEGEAGAYLQSIWYQDIEKLRILAAQMINATKEEVAFVKNTSEGISIVANGIDWQWGDRIITTEVEYPANVYPWMEVVRTRGAKLVMIPEETDAKGRKFVPVEKILEAAEDRRTKLVAISHVEYASGQRHDLARIGEFCRMQGKLLCVDAIQTVGVTPVDVQAMNIDFLAADGHKWMMGPEGAGIFYCRKELIERTRPLMVGWMNVINSQDYGNYDYTLRPDAGRFECGSHNVAGLLGLKASLEMLKSVGVENVAERLKVLTDRLVVGLTKKGYRVISPRKGEAWSGIVSFVSEKHKHEEIFRMLRKEKKIEIAVREGRLRCSPHFYNTEEQMDRVVAALPGH
jgi:cysteine desulfurase / selenocysteine lyase